MFGLTKSKKKSVAAKILVIDDEPDLVSTVQCRLEWCKFDVVTASNGQEGLEKATSEKPELILLDIDMPGMSGHEVLEHMSNRPDLKGIPVIMCTALCEAEDIAKASSYGVVDYIAKPFDFSELVEKISNVLGIKTLAEH
jgi:two-component system sensor histidine kinase/response regulator